jgi:hypothetical protein
MSEEQSAAEDGDIEDELTDQERALFESIPLQLKQRYEELFALLNEKQMTPGEVFVLGVFMVRTGTQAGAELEDARAAERVFQEKTQLVPTFEWLKDEERVLFRLKPAREIIEELAGDEKMPEAMRTALRTLANDPGIKIEVT